MLCSLLLNFSSLPIGTTFPREMASIPLMRQGLPWVEWRGAGTMLAVDTLDLQI